MLLKIVSSFVSYLQERNLLTAGAKAAIGDQLTGMVKLVKDAQDIRNSITTDNVGEQLDWLRPPSERTNKQ